MAKEVFILIRLIDMVEKCAQLSQNRISSEQHHDQITTLLDKYNSLKSKIPGYDLSRFVIEQNLEDCRFALDRIPAGPPKIKVDNSNKLVKLTSMFYFIQDLLLECQQDPKVSKLSPAYDDLLDLLEKATVKLPNYNSYFKELNDFNQRVLKKKYIMEVLTADEFTELQTITDFAFKSFLVVNQ